MGRNKIKIEKITNERNRHATFTKRKNGLFKKAMELSILCDCDIALVIVNSNDKYYQYSSGDIDEILKKRSESEYPSQSFSNKDYAVSFISKKQEDEFEEKEFDHDERDYYPTKSASNNSPNNKSSASHTPPPQPQAQQQQVQQQVQQVQAQQAAPKNEIFDPNFAPPHNEMPPSPNEWRGRGDQRSPQYPFQGGPERRDYPNYAYPATNYRPGSSYNIVAIPYTGGVYPYPHYPYGSPGQFNQPYMNPYQVHGAQPGEMTELAPDQKVRPEEMDKAGRAQFLPPMMPHQHQQQQRVNEPDVEHPAEDRKDQYQYVQREEVEPQMMQLATNGNHSNGTSPSVSPPPTDLDRKMPLNGHGHQMPPVFHTPPNGQTMMRGSAGLGASGSRKNGSPTFSSHVPTSMSGLTSNGSNGRSNSFYNAPQGRAIEVPPSIAMEEDVESKKTGRPEEKNDTMGSASKRPKLSIQIPSDSNGFESSISENYRKSPKSPSAFVSISPISFRPHQESLKFDVPFDFVASPFSYEMKSPKFPQELTNPFLSSLQEKKSGSS